MFTSEKESFAGSGEKYYHSEIQKFLIKTYFKGLESDECDVNEYGKRINYELTKDDLLKLTSHSEETIKNQKFDYANVRRSLERRVVKTARNGEKRRADNFFKSGFLANTKDVENCNKYPTHGERKDDGVYRFTVVLIPAIEEEEMKRRLNELEDNTSNEKVLLGEAQ